MPRHAFIPADMPNHPLDYSQYMNSKVFQYCQDLQDRNIQILLSQGKEFLDSIYEPRDLTCLHLNDKKPKPDVASLLVISNARNNGSFEFEAFELEYWTERALK